MSLAGQEKRTYIERLDKFIEITQAEVDKGANPGGYYKAVWARDAAFILKDQFLSGHIKLALQQILLIWSNQIGTGSPSDSPFLLYCPLKEKPLIYGRGSPEKDFTSNIADNTIKRAFQGALPTTIYYEKGFCEIYGQNPDIDSTALMISTTSWILSNLIDFKDTSEIDPEITLSFSEKADNKRNEIPFAKISLTDIINFLVPSMSRAVAYLQSRDIDGDGLLEQKHNEDWMDTLLRTGKVVYSQACWILALKNLSTLLRKIGNERESQRIQIIAARAIDAVEDKLWSEEDKCYVDQLDADLHLDEKMHNRFITQDVSLYLVALTEGYQHIANKENSNNLKKSSANNNTNLRIKTILRALTTLESLKKRSWKNNLPLVTETELTKTGPWVLKSYEYHNHTFWAWITGIEMLARSRFGRVDDCNIIMSKFVSDKILYLDMLYEWVNPLTYKGSGAYPFRTGISAVRIAAIESKVINYIENYDHVGENDITICLDNTYTTNTNVNK